MKIRIDALDVLFSKYVRLLSGGYCKRCWKMGKPNSYKGWKHLHCAHYHSRGDKSTRWDIDNVVAVCYGCHSWLDGHPLQKTEFFLELLGQARFDSLYKRNQTLGMPDKEVIKQDLKDKIKKLEA